MPATLAPWIASLLTPDLAPGIALLSSIKDGWQQETEATIRTQLGSWDALQHRGPAHSQAFETLVTAHIEWWERFFQAPRDLSFVAHRLAFGTTHADCGVDLSQLLATQSHIASKLTTHTSHAALATTSDHLQTITSFGRLSALDAALLAHSYENHRTDSLAPYTQEPSHIPILRIQGALVAALHNEIASQQFPLFRRELLQRIRDERIQHVLLDVSAIPYIDSIEFQALRDLIDLIALLGARACMVGLQPHVATALWAPGDRLQVPWSAGDIDAAFSHIATAQETHTKGPQS